MLKIKNIISSTPRIVLLLAISLAVSAASLLSIDTAQNSSGQGDFDGDGKVAFSDFLIFAQAFGSDDVRYDLTGDGRVDFPDFIVFAQVFGTVVQPSETASTAPDSSSSVAEPTDPIVVEYPLKGSPTEEHYRVAVILFKTSGIYEPVNQYPNHLKWPYTPKDLGDIYFNDPDGVDSFIREISYQKASLSGTVVGWFDIGEQDIDGNYVREHRDEFASLANDYIDYSEYDIFYLVGLVPGRGIQTGWTLQNAITTPQGTFNQVGIDYMVNSEFCQQAGNINYADCILLPSASWSHELLHTLGIGGHANSLDCGNETLLPSVAKINAYGNCFSVMGERAFATHPDIRMKEALGWVSSDQIVNFTTSGDYTIYPLETADANVKGLKIPLKNEVVLPGTTTPIEFDAMYIEYRQSTGFDRYLTRLDGGQFLSRYKPEGTVQRNGVLIYLAYKNQSTQATVLLDMHPATSYNSERGLKLQGNAGKFADAALPVGESFYNESNDLRIQVMENGADGSIVVKVEYQYP